MSADTTAEALASLAETSTEGLLRAAYALTHRIHETKSSNKHVQAFIDQKNADLRAQRDLITAEVLRRTLRLSPRDVQINHAPCIAVGRHLYEQTDHGSDYCVPALAAAARTDTSAGVVR